MPNPTDAGILCKIMAKVSGRKNEMANDQQIQEKKQLSNISYKCFIPLILAFDQFHEANGQGRRQSRCHDWGHAQCHAHVPEE